MHKHFNDMFAVTGTPEGDRLYFIKKAGGGGGGGTTVPPMDREYGGKSLPTTPSKTLAVREATADGKISETEKTTFKSDDSVKIVKDEETRLTDALKAQGAEPGRTGSVTMAPGMRGSAGVDTGAHAANKRKLNDSRTLDEIKKDRADTELMIKELPDTDGLKASLLKEIDDEAAARKTTELEVVDVIRDRRSLVGTLEAEKLQIDKTRPAAAQNDYQELREQAQPLINALKMKGGKVYNPDPIAIFDRWPTATDDLDFDKLVARFNEGEPGALADFRKNQPDKVTELAAAGLTSIINQYHEAKKGATSVDARVAEINDKQAELNLEIESDTALLSGEVRDDYAEEVAKAGEEAPAGGGDSDNEIPSTGLSPDERQEHADRLKKLNETKDEDGAGGSGEEAAIEPVTAKDIVKQHNNLGAKYTVRSGESLSIIAAKYEKAYGITLDWPKIYNDKANNKKIGSDPNLIHPGLVLNIPGIQAKIDKEVETANKPN